MLTLHPERHDPLAAEFCARFLSRTSAPRYVLGRNSYAASIAKCVEIDGFIDDFTHDTGFLGKPILKMDQVPRGSLVVSAVIFVVPLTALANLTSHGLLGLDYFKFKNYSGLPLPDIGFLTDSREDIKTHLPIYQSLHERMEDAESRRVLEHLLNFRYSGDLTHMLGFENAQDRQYFEGFLDLQPGDVFVDAGGFDGQTTADFIRNCPDYGAVHLFEPDLANLALARSNLSLQRDIHFHALGLAESNKTLRFSSGGGSASMVSETGDVIISVAAIDNVVAEPVSLIKMDIEGAEGAALTGARAHILQDHPKLAICCYHKFDDLWKIPEQVLAMRDDYSVYLRHYTEGLHETVVYFIPRG